MKKILISLLVVLSVVTLSGCGKKKDGEPKTVTKSIVLKDEGFGTTTLSYDIENDYDIKIGNSGKYTDVTVSSEKDNFELQLYHTTMYDTSFESSKETRKNSDNFKEYNWNGYNGYSYGGSKDSIKFNIVLDKDENGQYKLLFGSLESIDYTTANIPLTFESADIQNLLNTIKYTK